MANARYILDFSVDGQLGTGRTVRLLRPGKKAWHLRLPEQLDRGRATPELVDYVTTQYLLALPAEGVRLGWETIYSLVRTALLEADDEGGGGSGCAMV
jgi:hypothetical protein